MADALVKVLNRLGYQPVFLPRTGVLPPELYESDGRRLIRRGPLADKLPAVAGLPLSKGSLADIAHKERSTKSLEGATSFLAEALRCIGLDQAPKLDLSFTGGAKLSFAFGGVTYRAMDPTKLDELIKNLKTDAIPAATIERGKLHIAYEYAYARTLVMRREDGRQFSQDVSGNVGGFIDLGVKGSVEITRNTSVTFEGIGRQVAAFAYKAGQLVRDGAHWSFRPEVVRLGDGADEDRPFLPARGIVLRVDDPPA